MSSPPIHPAAIALAALPPSHLDAAARLLAALHTLTPAEANGAPAIVALLAGLQAALAFTAGDVEPTAAAPVEGWLPRAVPRRLEARAALAHVLRCLR